MYSVIAPYNVIKHCFRLAFHGLYRPTNFCKKSVINLIRNIVRGLQIKKIQDEKTELWRKEVHDYLTRSGEFIKPKEILVEELDMH